MTPPNATPQPTRTFAPAPQELKEQKSMRAARCERPSRRHQGPGAVLRTRIALLSSFELRVPSRYPFICTVAGLRAPWRRSSASSSQQTRPLRLGRGIRCVCDGPCQAVSRSDSGAGVMRQRQCRRFASAHNTLALRVGAA
eukprot:845542-Rhodomonas_salina.2